MIALLIGDAEVMAGAETALRFVHAASGLVWLGAASALAWALGALALGAALAIVAARLPRPSEPQVALERPRPLAPEGSVVDTLAARSGLPPLQVEHALDQPLLDELVGLCPLDDPDLAALCDPSERARVEAA